MLSRVPSQVAVFASLCTQVSLQQLWSTRHQITFQIRHNATDSGDGLASFPPVWQVPDASARCISSSRLDASSQSWEVGNVGKEALSPPLLQVYGHKVCTEGRTAGETRDESLTSDWIKWASTFSTREQNVTLTAEEFQPASLIDSLSFTWMESSFCHMLLIMLLIWKAFGLLKNKKYIIFFSSHSKEFRIRNRFGLSFSG